MMAGAVLTPPVIHYHLVLDRAIIIEPSKESCGVPVRVRTLPLSIRPDQVGLVAVNKVVQLWHCFRADKMLSFETIFLVE